MAVTTGPNAFILDSGASNHMVHDKSLLYELVLNDHFSPIFVGGEGKCTVIGSGKLVLGNVILNEVLWVPDLGFNLISVSALSLKNCKTLIENNAATVHFEDSIIMTAGLSNGIYYIKQDNNQDEVALLSNYDRYSMKGFHKKLGHISRSILDEIIKHNTFRDMRIISKAPFDCTACMIGKQQRDSFSGTRAKAKEILDLIHVDLGFLSVPGKEGHDIFMTMVDDYWGFVKVALLTKKSQAVEAYVIFKNYCETKFSRKMKAIRFDSGKEFINAEFKDILEADGTEVLETHGYTPELNYLAERYNRVLVELAWTNLLLSGLPEDFGDEAILYSAFNINMIPREFEPGKFKSAYEI